MLFKSRFRISPGLWSSEKVSYFRSVLVVLWGMTGIPLVAEGSNSCLCADTERSTYTQKVDFAKLRSELLNADSTEAQLTRSSHEKIAADLAKLNSRLRDEIGRTQASVRLDLNLEKGRIREEANGQEMRIKETETRIEQEVAGLRERVEAVKFSTLQWLMYNPFLPVYLRKC